MLLKRFKKPTVIDENINDRITKYIRSISETTQIPAKHVAMFEDSLEVLIPCYNHSAYLRDAFNSILQQSNKTALDITFINDNSSDNSLTTMYTIQRTHQSQHTVKVINNKKNLLQSGSINRAVLESKNKLFIILNADDLLTPDCLDLIIKTFQKNTDIFMLGGSSLWFDSSKSLPKHNIKQLRNLRLSKYGPNDAKKFDSPNSINMSHSSLSFFREAWELSGGYYPQRKKRVCSHDDRDFQMRVCALLPIGIYQDYPMEFYRTNSSQNRGTV